MYIFSAIPGLRRKIVYQRTATQTKNEVCNVELRYLYSLSLSLFLAKTILDIHRHPPCVVDDVDQHADCTVTTYTYRVNERRIDTRIYMYTESVCVLFFGRQRSSPFLLLSMNVPIELRMLHHEIVASKAVANLKSE